MVRFAIYGAKLTPLQNLEIARARKMVLARRIAVITGAAQGIGRAIALRLAQDGANIAVVDLDIEGAGHVAAEIEAIGRQALAVKADLLKREEVVRAFAEVDRNLGPVDVLVNNAGQGARQFATEFWEADLDTLDWMIDLNLRSAIWCSHQVASSMRERRSGRIINISSEAAFIGSKFASGYAAAKAGITGFTRSLAREMAPHGVNVNAIAPGFTRTRALDLLAKPIVDKAISEIPLGHAGEPEDIAGVVAFFAGPDSSFVTGQCLLANGGRHMH